MNCRKMKLGCNVDNTEELIPLSLLSQANYCLRRAALIWNERVWAESADTAEGRTDHEKVHEQRIERRGSEIKLFEYEVFSNKLSLIGKCDCIEAEMDANGCCLPSVDFPVRLFPVEYKHGKEREEFEYEVQLCAQAICLEEMFNTHIPSGAIFYIKSHRRHEVSFTAELRKAVEKTISRLRDIREDFLIPPPVYTVKCSKCSLLDYCQPDIQQSAKAYCETLKREARGELEL